MGRRITALTPQKKNPNRVNVYLDGEFAFGLYHITAAWLRLGQELSDEKTAELQEQDGQEAAYQQALRLLEYRPRSSAEVRRNLEKHGLPQEAIDATLARLENSGLVDDARFAREWVENRSTFRPRSQRALAYELRQKGIASEAVEEAVQPVDEEAVAYAAAQRQTRKIHAEDWPKFRSRLAGFLARRGFGYEITAQVTRRVWDERMTDRQENNDHFEEE